MMKLEYIFKINNVPCEPIYSDSLSLVYEIQSNEMFYRRKLSGVLTFVGADYDFIISKPFETSFNVEIFKNGSLYYSGVFTRLNCEENLDDKNIKVNLEDLDEYTEFLNKYDIKHNIIKLKPELQHIKIDKRPILQVLVRGSNMLTCYQGGNKWDEPVYEMDASIDKLTNKYKFAHNSNLFECSIVDTRAPIAVRGLYIGNTHSLNGVAYRTGGGEYKIIYFKGVFSTIAVWFFQIRKISNDTTVYEGYAVADLTYEQNISMKNAGSNTEAFTAKCLIHEVFARYVTARQISTEVPGVIAAGIVADNLPIDDIIQYSPNHRYALAYTYQIMFISSNYSVNPTEYGKNNEGSYFDKPDIPPGRPTDLVFTAATDRWIRASIWFMPIIFDHMYELGWRQPYVMRDAYVLHSVIDKLVKQINSNYYFNKASSTFLYGSVSVKDDNSELFITQKTNILKGQYDQAAQFAEVSLKQILDMLRAAFDCRWRLDGNQLIIEHLHFFKNGSSYLINPVVDLDLTGVYHNKHLKSYTFATSKYTYDSGSIASIFEYEWLDSVGPGFKLAPVNVVSPLVKAEKTEKISISSFNPDIDLMLTNSSSVSQDGFALMAAVPSGVFGLAPFELPYVGGMDVAGVGYTLQNGLLSLKKLVSNYHLYDKPFSQVKINGQVQNVNSLQRLKKQNIWYSDTLDPVFTRLVRTDLGDGFIQKASINLTSRRIDLELSHDTY